MTDSENNPDKEKDVSFLDLFNPNKPRSEEELIEYRMGICKTCPLYHKATNRCTKCGCFMKLKTTLLQAKCPVGKW